MQTICLTISRFCLAAWVGAATLFVVTSVAEVSEPTFDSTIKSALAVLRFPYYYFFGFALVGFGFLAGWLARKHPSMSPGRMKLFAMLMLLALAAMVADYFVIYQPLNEMLQSDVRPANFHQYHQGSKYINLISLLLVFVSAVLVCGDTRSNGESA